MRHPRYLEEKGNQEPEFLHHDFYKWLPIFQRLGLKPRRYVKDNQAIYAGTAEGWFRLSLKKYDKQELKWLRSILEYLDDRAFRNWAVPWQKTIIWEEHSFCYLIQPWLMIHDHFKANDPASITRIAEIMADIFNCGKDYSDNRGIRIARDSWQSKEVEWELMLQKLDQYKNNDEHEKTRKEFDELRKNAIIMITESLDNWKKSGLSTLLAHHRQSGVLGHGDLTVKNIIWCGNDYYLLNWENMSFQPRIEDIASLINDVAWWEPEWILFLLNEYSKILPFWPEEQLALFALLKFPTKVINLLFDETAEAEFDRKNLKEVAKELTRKDRCLGKAWKELGSQKRWAWSKENEVSSVNQGRISMVLSPVESWGDFTSQVDSLIQVKNEQKLPSEVIDRLTYQDPDRIVAGRDGNILESAAKNNVHLYENNPYENGIEIVEPQPKIPEEKESGLFDENNGVNNDIHVNEIENVTPVVEKVQLDSEKSKIIQDQPIRWSNFPKKSRSAKQS